MYELIVLSLLMHGPMHGYLIAKIANDINGPWSKVSVGTLYGVLAKLEAATYIRASEDPGFSAPRGKRQTKVYQITQGGKMRFHQLMMDTASASGDYQKLFHLKVPYLHLLAKEERLHLLNHYLTYCETAVLYTQSERDDLIQTAQSGYDINPDYLEAVIDLMDHQVTQWRDELAWANCVRERVQARASVKDQTTGSEGGGRS